MHGCGNDYVYINCFEQEVADPAGLSKYVSDRHFGIGSDGLVLIMPSQTCDFRMRMFNADGSEAQMCGNASRCVAKYCYDNRMTAKKEFTLETLAGVKILKVFTYSDLGQSVEGDPDTVAKVTVNMGEPVLEPSRVPVICNNETICVSEPLCLPKETIDALPGPGRGDLRISMTAVSMGNPHAVYFMDSVEDLLVLPLEQVGPVFENHPAFPERINSEFVYIYDRNHAKMRVWERGSGETWACGTGSCATLVACVLNGRTDREITLDLNGGSLDLRWDEETNCVFMTGPATKVFEGTVEY